LIKPPKLVDLYYTMAYAPLKIRDFPRYPYRGLMLDTARRYYTVDSILQILDAMHVAKFNVLHWHLVEDESFPLELKTFQNVHKNAAFK
jgi:hexosaminidase